MNFQAVVTRLNLFWEKHGCLLLYPYDVEKGAGTFNPATFLRCLGKEHWKAAYVEPSRRPTDGRFGVNPNRLRKHFQYQVILKPSETDVRKVYIESLKKLGIYPAQHDIRFIEDNWESPTLGAWGIGWEVWLDGLEITQFTYFQQIGGIDLDIIPVEITYGLERIAMYIQGKSNIFDIEWSEGITYGKLFLHAEQEFSSFNFDLENKENLINLYRLYKNQARTLLDKNLILPAYDFVMKCSHVFNILDASGSISIMQRTSYVNEIRKLSCQVAKMYLEHIKNSQTERG